MHKEKTTASVVENSVGSLELPADGCCVRLSESDASEIMAIAENPPKPNAAALEAAKRFLQKHG